MRVRGGARKDANQSSIVAALQKMGAHVEVTNMANWPDLVVLFRNTVTMVEVKNPEASKGKRALRPGQEAFRVRWTAAGGRHARVETVDEALAAVGLAVKAG